MLRYLTNAMFIVGSLLLVWHHTAWAGNAPAGGASERECHRIKESVASFAKEKIFPFIETKEYKNIDWSVVSEVKALRRDVQLCSFPLELPSRTPWNEDEFTRLDGKLAYFEVTLEQAAEEESPEITRILFSSPGFHSAVESLKAVLGLEEAGE